MELNKEKQIEEMAKDMCEYYYEGTCYQDKKPCDCKCECFTDAQYLYAKGYRKASDVAEDIFSDIESILFSLMYLDFDGKYHLRKMNGDRVTKIFERYANIKKKYTEEVK